MRAGEDSSGPLTPRPGAACHPVARPRSHGHADPARGSVSCMTSTFAPSRLAQDHPPVTRPAQPAPFADAVRDAAVRATLATGLAGIAVIHAVDSVGQWDETRYLFWMYM